MAAISRKIFLTVCNSVKEQQKGSEAALICTCFQEASGTFTAVVPSHTPCSERHSTQCTSSNMRRWMGWNSAFYFSFFSFLKAFEQFTAINKHARRSNRLRAGQCFAQKPVGRGAITRMQYPLHFPDCISLVRRQPPLWASKSSWKFHVIML